LERYCLSQECLSFSLSLQAESKERRLQNSGLSSGRYEDNLGFACKCLDIESGLSSFYVKRYNKIVEFGYNSRNMATDISSAPLSLLYTYSPGGNITRITDNSGTSPIVLNYTYDAIGQLKSAQANGPDGIYTISYGYDGTSNRVSEIYRNSENQVVSQKGYVYTAGDYLVSTSDSSSTVSYVWDIYGQLSSKSSGEEYIFSGKRNLNSVAASNTVQEIYTYDALGRRLKVENADITTLNFPLGNDTSYEIKTEGSDVTKTRYISANGKYLAKTVKVNDEPESKYFHHIDLVGSIRAITDISGTVVSSYEYEPFGVVTLSSGTDEDNLGFAGKRLDIGSGLSYFGARYYDSDMGRFISRDPAQDGRNWFVYCANNPLLYVDPNGLSAMKVEIFIYAISNGGIKSKLYTILGHADIAIGDTLYSFGRYDKYSVHGLFSFFGDGVIYKADRNSALANQLKSRDVIGYEINVTEEESKRLIDHFESLISQSEPWLSTSDKANGLSTPNKFKPLKHLDESRYELLKGDNCVTFVVNALKKSLDPTKLPLGIKNIKIQAPNGLGGILSLKNQLEWAYDNYRNFVKEINYYPSTK